MDKIFDIVQVEQPNRNMFDLTHDHKTTMDMGNLVPICVMECIPGDRYTIGSQSLIRFAPMVAPPMQRFDARIEYFWVANRLIWKNWMPFISSDPGDTTGTVPAFPTITVNSTNYTTLMNYMGIPRPVGSNSETINALPLAAYQLIYDNYYRDQNLIPQEPNAFTLNDGDNTGALVFGMGKLQKRAWMHDYFTSCLPFAQKGNPVTIGTTTYTDVPVLRNTTGGPITSVAWDGIGTPGGGTIGQTLPTGLSDIPGQADGRLYADTSTLQSLSVTINDLREAEALQKWLEINARAGTRPNEIIQGHFGVKSSDARLQRPEYIVGVKQPISISEVLNTSGFQIDPTTGDDLGAPQGTMAGHGVGMIDDENYGSFFCEEHGFIIGIMSVMPTTSYQQGLEKFWLKTKDATQYFFPSFAHLGEQPVYNKELLAFRSGTAGDDVFGYLPAYQDYRFKSSVVTGDFQTSLSFWHAGRIFDPSSPPVLDGSFISADVRKDIFAVNDPDVNSLYVHVLNKVFASRLIPTYGTPSL